MKLRRRPALALTLLVMASACSPTAPVVDAGRDVATTPTDAADVASDTASDVRADTGCADVSGYFEIAGTCTGQVPPHNGCITQTACALSAATDIGTLTGTVTGSSVMLTGSTIGGGTATCTGTATGGSLTLSCDLGGGAPACALVGTHNNVLGASRVCCSVAAQDCGDGQRCNLVSVANPDGISTTACLMTMGSVAEGAACTRMPVGYDNCAPGLYCAGTGSPAGTTSCRKLCALNSDCPATDVCVTTGSGPLGGFCVARCDMFGAACGTGLGCAVAASYGAALEEDGATICSALGTAALGATCMANTDCASGFCEAAACVAPCNAAHPCAGAATCRMLTGFVTGVDLGFCM